LIMPFPFHRMCTSYREKRLQRHRINRICGRIVVKRQKEIQGTACFLDFIYQNIIFLRTAAHDELP
jgi:hypothetical protein